MFCKEVFTVINLSDAYLRLRYNANNIAVSQCAGFGWDTVDFLHSSWYGAMFWICAENC